jgi:hypothetical protein
MRVFALVLPLILAVSGLPAHAYDEDTHFYGTYSMARFAGIRHEVAVKIALGAQWMDESFISDPTSLLILPITGVKKRRLLHFPSSRVEGRLAGYNQDDTFGFKINGLTSLVVQEAIKLLAYKGDLSTLVAHTTTEPNHEFASSLLMEGLKEGNLMKASASLHTIEDSFAHAGTSAELGHTALWHWPDRPFDDVAKYLQMTEVVFKALVAIRAQLPESALDCSLKSGPTEANCQLNAEDLVALYDVQPEVAATVSANVLHDPKFIQVVLRDFVDRALASGYLIRQTEGSEFYYRLLDTTLAQNAFVQIDTYEMCYRYILDLVAHGKLLDLQVLPKDMGLVSDPTISFSDFLQSFAQFSGPDQDPTGVKPFVREMVHRVLAGYVAAPLTDIHREEVEDDNAIPRRTEMQMRSAAMQALIARLYGTQVELVANNSKDDVGFVNEVLLKPAANPAELTAGKVSMNLQEKNAWDNMVFHYLFPNLAKTVLPTLAKVMVELNHPNQGWGWIDAVKNMAMLTPFIHTYFSDTVNTHIEPLGDEKFYQNPELLARVKTRSPTLYPKFFGPKDVWSIDARGSVHVQTAASVNP